MDAAAGESAPSSARKMSRSCSARLARLAVVLLVASLLTTADSCSVTQNGTEMTVAVVYASNASPRDTVVATFQSSGVTATAADNTYIKVGFNTTTGDIELITTEAFESYEKTNEVSTFGIYITCTCKDSANALSLQVNVQLNLTNKYAPVFISDGAEVAAAVALTAAMPLHKGSVLLGGCDRALQAVDYGLDSSTVRFSVSDDWFAVSASPASVGPSGKPGYEVKVTTARLLDLEEPRVFTLTATDGGSPPRSTELKITVTPDAAQSTPPSPWFEQPVYTAELTESMSSGDELTFNTGITISEGYDSAMKISLETTDSTDWSSMFSVHHSSKSVQIRLAQNLTEELLKKPFVAFILKANRDNALKEGRTVILLTLPGSKPITTTTSTTITTTSCPTTVTESTAASTTQSSTTCYTDCSLCTSLNPTRTTKITSPTGGSKTVGSLGTTPMTPGGATTTQTPDCSLCPASSPSSPTASGSSVVSSTVCPPCPTATTDCPVTSGNSTDCSHCPTVATECPATSSSKTTPCPTDCSQCPTSESSTKPGASTQCPTDCSQCPTVATECPATSSSKSTPCPTDCSQCPTSESSTKPGASTQCPTDCSQCPTVATECPATSSSKSTPCPTDCSQCPTSESSTKPGASTLSPTDCSQCPTVATECPATSSSNTTPCHMSCSQCPASECSTIAGSSTVPTTECPPCPAGNSSSCTTDCSKCQPSTTVYPGTGITSVLTSTICPPCSTATTECPTTSVSSVPCPTNCSQCPIITTECPTTSSSSSTSCPTDCSTCPASECSTAAGASTTLFTECPQCPQCPTVSACPPTVSGTATCPPCPTAEVGTTVGTTSTQSSVPTETTSASSTVTAPARLVRFNSSLYEFSGSWPCHGPHLVLGRVEASVVGGVGSPAYSLEGAPDSVKIDNATGVLTLQRPLVPKFYHFKVVAEWNNSRDEATVAVAVFNLQSCAANSTGLQYVFVIADFDEESEHSISGAQLLNETSCVWAKVSEDPPDRNFFDVASDGAVSTKGIDREDAVFAGRNLSEVLLTVNVTCDGQQDEVSAPEDSSDPTKAWYPLKNLRTSSREVSYLAVVNDINDNRPQFEEGASLVVGYPDEQLARQLAPRSLVTVHATDKDEGLNAYVRYEIAGDGGNQFVVHPHSGAVYPAESGFQFRDTGFQVLARDRDGAAGCLQSDPLSVQVRMLGSRHVTVLTVEDRLVEDSDAVLGQLRAGSGLDVKLLAAAVLPSAATRSRLAARPGSLLRLVAYALNSSDHTPVPFSDLKKTLDGASLGFKWGISQLADPGSATTLASGADSSGLVAAVATLGVLLALAVAAVLGGTYFFIIRRRRGSSEGSYDNIIRADSSDSPTLNEPPMSAYEANIMVAYNEQLNKYDGQQRGPPLDGTEEEEEEGEEGEAPPRKSVAFSPTVDRIGDDESDVDVIRL
ncbi:mucin-5AC-like isoform X2 [Bacillus rossius redtenbacheri]|uniref:mucin-5AC-like isoform X2 n=1 Tax=Bacillus rossius redtenbacheri TaxID=93214 RepID=UPI002FDCCDDD